jgi:hypothetical protein
MNYQELDLEEYLVQRTMKEYPREIRSVLSRIMEDIFSGKSKGKVAHDLGDRINGDFNLIPSDRPGRCCAHLVAICYDEDNFDSRIRKCLDHAAIICPNQNHEIFFFSTQWDSKVAGRYTGYIDSLRRNGVLVNMIHVTRKGQVLMPV